MNTYRVTTSGYDSDETAEVKADSFAVNENGVTFYANKQRQQRQESPGADPAGYMLSYAGGFPSPVAYFKSVRSVELVEDEPATEAAPSDDIELARVAYRSAQDALADARRARDAAWRHLATLTANA